MRIAWITPCFEMYNSVNIYFEDVERFNWPIHIFHDIDSTKLIQTKIFQPHISGLEDLRKNYVVLHYFLDDCEKCKEIEFKSIFGQRLFISRYSNNQEFKEIIFKYLEVI